MTYREKLAKIIDVTTDRLLLATAVSATIDDQRANLEVLERLCRCAKILGDEEAPDLNEPIEEEDLVTIAGTEQRG